MATRISGGGNFVKNLHTAPVSSFPMLPVQNDPVSGEWAHSLRFLSSCQSIIAAAPTMTDHKNQRDSFLSKLLVVGADVLLASGGTVAVSFDITGTAG
ncbi:hypothetical protein [Prosthecobacter sp.]|uniref:hypothetical protein n=1 Tax=Prosthecobacter sp. TaxID=1965333 RepID=UPI0037848812